MTSWPRGPVASWQGLRGEGGAREGEGLTVIILFGEIGVSPLEILRLCPSLAAVTGIVGHWTGGGGLGQDGRRDKIADEGSVRMY